MNQKLKEDSLTILKESLDAVQPDKAVRRALEGKTFPGRVILIAVGKAAWKMARAAVDCLKDQVKNGLVITKYGHAGEELTNIRVIEAGHPVSDQNSRFAAEEAIRLVRGLAPEDTVLFLLSGGGSSLFELPLIPMEEYERIVKDLLACGADIVEMNTVRKRLSGVKGGRFAERCAPAQVFSVILSDIIGDPADMIASGPTVPDASTCKEAEKVIAKYGISISSESACLLRQETPKYLPNASHYIVGSVRELCKAAEQSARRLGYRTIYLTDCMCTQAREAGIFLSCIAKSHANEKKNLAFIAGGETVVKLTGKGKGGRNQELALAAAEGIAGLNNVCIFSFGSDGTDGPTDAAGGIVFGSTQEELSRAGFSVFDSLLNNDAYHALSAVDGLLITGPTGTNVNDVSLVLIRSDS